ncbi:MAG: LacI family DNA-binding transcriptional regulator [Sedimentisphaerales bacterium]
MQNYSNMPEIVAPASRIAFILREEISRGIYTIGEKLSNERILAERFNVSRGTIRQTLQILAAERLIIRQQGRGTYITTPAYAPATEVKSSMIGAMVYEKEYYFGAILQEASHCAGARGYVLITGSNATEEMELQHVDAFLKNGIRGVILAPVYKYSARAYDMLISKNIPVVMLDTLLPDREEDFVAIDNRHGIYMVTRHLIGLGHTKIGYVGHDERHIPCKAAQLSGFYDACAQNEIEVRQSWQIEANEDNYLAKLEAVLRQQDRPTAFVSYNDIWAVRVVRVARSLRLRVPEDLSVTGFDDSTVARNHDTPITTVSSESNELGKAAIDMLLKKIENPIERPKYTFMVQPRLVVRKSTARPF